MIGQKRGYTWIPLVLLTLAAVSLRVYGLNWDDGHLFHPDERHILMVTQKLALPDPLSLSAIADPQSPLNPQSFAYGSLSFYLLSIVTQLLAKLSPLLQPLIGHPVQPDLENMRLIGRTISATFDTGTVLLTYMLGKKLYGERVGLLGSAFVAFATIHIQLSHFYAPDTILTFLIVLSTLAAFELTKGSGARKSALAGAAIGLALATKASAAPIWIVVIVAHALRLFTRPEGKASVKWDSFFQRVPEPKELRSTVLSAAISASAAAVVFVAAQPYFIFDFNTFMRNVLEQNDMVRGIADLPYTRQYINTPAYLYQLQNLVVWGLGVPLGVVGLVGLSYVVARSSMRPRGQDIFLLSWVLIYFLITGSFHAKFMRYLLPIVPFICLFGAAMLVGLWEHFRQKMADTGVNPYALGPHANRPPTPIRSLQSAGAYAAAAVTLGVVFLTLFYAVAFVNIYSSPHTAVDASRWIYRNVPKGSGIAVEHWEEGMPVPLVDEKGIVTADSQGYRTNILELYEADGPAKRDQIVEKLRNSDFIILFSNRLYGTIPRLPERYPLTTRYYQMLFGEQLGFRLEAAFTSFPNLLGLTLVDDTFAEPKLPAPAILHDFRPSALTLNLGKADESFTVYDHPKVLVFQKMERLSAEELRNRLGEANPPPARGDLLLPAERYQQMKAGGTFAEMFSRSGLENQIPIVVWALLVQLLGLAAAPLAFKALGNLPDKGYGAAKTIGVLLLGWSTWLVASIGLLPNTRGTIAAMLLLTICVGAGLLFWQRRTIAEFVRTRRGLILSSELVFWGAFGLFLAIRLANPDLWHPYRGGEKPMDLAYLMAAIKSVQFPPYDPWFAGGYMNYYYFGQVIVATLIKLSGIVPTTAYNLAVPLLFALTASCVFSVTYALVVDSREKGIDVGGLLTGLGAVAFAVLVGNLGGAVQMVDQFRQTGASGAATSSSAVSFLNALWSVLSGARGIEISSDWYWASTRVIEGTINEFPFFTFLYADLHAHMIALPFTMLVLAFAVQFVKERRASRGGHSSNPIAEREGTEGVRGTSPRATSTTLPAPIQSYASDTSGPAPVRSLASNGSGPEREERGPCLPRRTGLALQAQDGHCVRSDAGFAPTNVPRPSAWSLALAALALGSLYVTNSWDFPTYGLVLSAGILLHWYRSVLTDWRTLFIRASDVVIVAGLSVILYLPFHRSFQSFYFGVEPSPDKSDLRGYLVIHGLFLFALVSFLTADVIRRHGDSAVLRTLHLVLASAGRGERLARLYMRLVKRVSWKWPGQGYGITVSLALLGLLIWLKLHVVAFLLGILFVAVGAMARRRRPVEETFVLILVVVGLFLGIAVEFFAIKGDVGRMNTVFKFYLQVWMLWSIAGAFAIRWVVQRIARDIPAGRYVWVGILAFLIGASTVYTLVGTRARVNDRFDNGIPPTLDGTAYMSTAVYRDQNGDIALGGDLKAIRWIQDNVVGSPVILEGRTPVYRWGSRVSIYTGLPTVLGWDWHQKQQRWGYQWMVDKRAADVAAMYSSSSQEQTMALLKEYDVSYIYVGELERLYYPQAGIRKFDAMLGKHLDIVYDEAGVRIYKVKG